MTGDGQPATSTHGGWERQVLDSIESALGASDPKLASQLAMFSRLASSEKMPAGEKVRSPLRHPPHRRRRRLRRRRQGKALRHGRRQHRRPGVRAAAVAWIVTSVVLITVAVVLSHGGAASCTPTAAAPAATVCGGSL